MSQEPINPAPPVTRTFIEIVSNVVGDDRRGLTTDGHGLAQDTFAKRSGQITRLEQVNTQTECVFELDLQAPEFEQRGAGQRIDELINSALV